MIGFFITSKLRIAREVHFRTVFVSKNAKKLLVLGIFPEYFFPFRRFVFSSSVSPIAEGRIFVVFSTDTKRLRVFARAEASLQKKSKNIAFFGHFSRRCFSFSCLCLYTMLFGSSTTSGRASEKMPFFSGTKKLRFLGCAKMLLFWEAPPLWRLLQGCRRIESSQKAARLRFITLS